MSVLKSKRTKSSIQYLKTADDIFSYTANFCSRLSPRYTRIFTDATIKMASMDDYYILLPTGDIPDGVLEKAKSIGLTVNKSKTVLKPLSKPFRFCKIRYSLGERVKTVGSREAYQRAKRKINLFIKTKSPDCAESLNATISYFNNYNDSLRKKRLFDRMAKEGICTMFVSGASVETQSVGM